MNIISKEVIHTIELDGERFKRYNEYYWEEEVSYGEFEPCDDSDMEVLEEQFQEAIKELKFITNDFK